MILAASQSQISLLLLALFAFLARSSAAITPAQFAQSFSLYTGSGPGGCDRQGPKGSYQDWSLQALDDAWTLSGTATTQLQLYKTDDSTGKLARGLFFLFFGLNFTRKYELNPYDDSQLYYYFVKQVFGLVTSMKTAPTPNARWGIPKFRCTEDYAFYTQHLVGTDRKENMSAPLAGEYFKKYISTTAFYPGLMYGSVAPDSFYYPPDKDNPPGGVCGGTASNYGAVAAFTMYGADKFGITICPILFTMPQTNNLAVPTDNLVTYAKQIDTYRQSAGVQVLHEMVHAATYGKILDQPQVAPTVGRFSNTNWSQWALVLTKIAYGWNACAFLGLARPDLGRYNADSYAIFAMCLNYPGLDCLGAFEDRIRKREKLPFVAAPRAVRKIRGGRFSFGDGDVEDGDGDE